MNLLDSIKSGPGSILFFLIVYLLLGIGLMGLGLFLMGYSKGRVACDPDQQKLNQDQYNGGIASLVFGCIFIIVYHVIKSRID